MTINSIEGVKISADRPYIIAEAGVNHEGNYNKAVELIDAAAESGADMIKFQSYKAETIASKNSPAYWDQSKEPANSQFELFKRYDAFNIDTYQKLAERCRQKNIAFCSTPFDAEFVEALAPFMPVYKIASADITNYPLLRQVAQKGKPVLLSTGASYLSEIARAVKLLEENGIQEIALLHCVLEYPTKSENCNLRIIQHLQHCFPRHTIGWSDHVPPYGHCISMITAWMMGATILEKHFTLDKSLPGNDHYHAMDPDDLHTLRESLELARTMLGANEKFIPSCEFPARKQARRSLVAKVNIPAGTPIEESMIIPKRPGTGISPDQIDLIIGRTAQKNIAADDILDWEMFFFRESKENFIQ